MLKAETGGPANISLTGLVAAASSVAMVEFLADGTKIGEALAAPYAMTWTNAALGAYALQARVVDNLGGTALSAPVYVSVLGGAWTDASSANNYWNTAANWTA